MPDMLTLARSSALPPPGLVASPAASSVSLASHRKRSHGSVVDAASPDSIRKPKIKKTTRACDFCKSKKLRCTGSLPCDNCLKRELECVYDAEYRRGRPPTPPPIGGHRESRVVPEELVESLAVPTATPMHQDVSLPIPEPSDTSLPLQDRASTSRGSPELESAEIEGQYFDPTSSLTFLHRAWKRLSTARGTGDGTAPLVPRGAEQHQGLFCAGDRPYGRQMGILALPDRATALEMINFYFETCVITYRCLHRQYVTEWCNILITNQEAMTPHSYGLGHAKASIVLTILAIVTLRKDKLQGNDYAGVSPMNSMPERLQDSDAYFCASVDLTAAETGYPKLESVQARVLQVLYLLQAARMNQAWYTFGTTLPLISALGLHRRPGRKHTTTKQSHHDYIISQCRKRTFWVAYTIDKYLAIVFGRPALYNDDDVDQDFPDRVNDEDMTAAGRLENEASMDCHIDSTIFHAKIARLIDRTSREVYSIKAVPKRQRLASAQRLCQELHAWRESLPPHLGTIKPSSLIPIFRRQATALKLAYCHAIMHANRPFLLGATSPRTPALAASVTECIGAARDALETVDAMAVDGTQFHAYWWTPYVTFCALAVVYVWELQQKPPTGPEGTPLLALAERCQNHLARSAAPESLSRRYSVILEELKLEAQKQAAGLGRANGTASRPQPPEGAMARMSSTTTVATTATATPRYQVMELADMSQQMGLALNQQVSPQDSGPQGYYGTGFLDGWQTIDWLDLDSSALGPLPDFDTASPMM